MMKIFKGKIILKDGILDGYVAADGGKIVYIGENRPEVNADTEYAEHGYIAPGFIDIHCHSSRQFSAKDNPAEVADFHLNRGVTTMLLTFYRDIGHKELSECLKKTASAMKTKKNVYGAHLEGPYINASLGYGTGEKLTPDEKIYGEYIKTGIVRQWTCSPEIEGTEKFIENIRSAGIVPAIGHSRASYPQVKAACEKGAKIATHLFDATGCAEPPLYKGTESVSFNEACMLMDDMFYEVILDSEWIHVKKEKLDLLIKTVGENRVVAVSDMSCAGAADDGRDVNIENGDLCGTKLTMDRVARNLFRAGYGLNRIFKLTSLNAARALGLDDRGEIAVGKRAHLIYVDENAGFKKILSF